MKRYFYLGLSVMLTLIIGLVTYGAYLNLRDEAQISKRISEHTISLQGSKAKIRNINENIEMEVVNLYSDDKTDVLSLIEGRITSIGVQKDESVRKGEVLFVLTNELYPLKIRQAEIDILKVENEIISADNDIRKAEIELAHAKSNFNRYDQLRAENAISLEKYEEMEAIYKESQITLENMRLQKDKMLEQKKYLEAQKEQLLVEIAYSQVRAPIDGDVLILYKQIGEYVTGGTALALIGNFDNLYISMPMEDKKIRRLAVGQEAVLSFNHKALQKVYDLEYEAGNKGSLQTFNAKILEISPSLDKDAAIRKVIWQVDNSSGILEPQTYGSATFEMKSISRCLTIPMSAMEDVTNTSVFVWTEDKTIQRRHVTTGINDGKYIEIVSGLKEGEVVITSSTDGLEDGMVASVTFNSEED